MESPASGSARCFRFEGDIARQQLSGGDTWIGVSWLSSTGMAMMVDSSSVGNTKLSVRARVTSSSNWIAWQDHPTASIRVFLIRLGVDHGGSTPDPDPDPDPPPTTGCTPTTTALQFDGGYKLSMCYRTPEGEEGQAKSGVWASGQSGILWFFNRENAEVLVKVLDGCAHNGYRWVFVAPVTTLEFNLWVTGPNRDRWTHSNQQNVTAATKSDTSAFKCADEPDDDGDDHNGDDGDGDGDDDDDSDGSSGQRYNVGDVITTLPSDSWPFGGLAGGCSFGTSGGLTRVACSRNGYVESGSYRYTCDASTCRIEGRRVTAGTWVETHR